MNEGKLPTRQGVADILREKSKAGQLVSAEELWQGLRPEHASTLEESEATTSAEALLPKAMAENEDLREVKTKEGCAFYYSSTFMSETYARLLLCKQEGPTQLVADTVREDSDRYPRPTPLEVFKEPPFDLSQEEILSCLEEMSSRVAYQDISRVSTSMGRVFLYSTRHLDRDYALMLAEWIDVGQFENP